MAAVIATGVPKPAAPRETPRMQMQSAKLYPTVVGNRGQGVLDDFKLPGFHRQVVDEQGVMTIQQTGKSPYIAP